MSGCRQKKAHLLTKIPYRNTIYYIMQLQRSIINISVPPALAKRIEKIAKEENRTKSELLREAFRVYEFHKDWAKIRAWGQATARKMGIKTEDDVERIAG